MLLHVSTFELSSSVSSLRLAKHNELPEDDIFYVETCRCMLFVIIVFDIIVQSVFNL